MTHLTFAQAGYIVAGVAVAAFIFIATVCAAEHLRRVTR